MSSRPVYSAIIALFTTLFAQPAIVQAASICNVFEAEDAIIVDGVFGDLDHKDNKWVKLESRGGRSQNIKFNGSWKLSRNAQIDKIQGLSVPIFVSSKTTELVVGIFLYNVRTRGWHPIISTEPTKFGDAHAPVLREWRDYYDEKTREIKFRITARKNGSRAVDLNFDQLSIRPLWHLQEISHDMAKKVSDGNIGVLREHHLDDSVLQPGKELRRPQLQPGERFLKGDANVGSLKADKE